MRRMRMAMCLGILGLLTTHVKAEGASAQVTIHSARNGVWSTVNTWVEKRLPAAGDIVQIRAGHTITYDVNSDRAIRMIQVGGTLTFSHKKSTRLDVGLIKVQAGDLVTEDGFRCDAHMAMSRAKSSMPLPALEIGTANDPIPANITATVRLVYFAGTDKETLPAIIDCGGRWDVHGAPMRRTWVKLGASVKPGDTRILLAEPVTGWRIGDHILVTASKETGAGGTFRKGVPDAAPVGTEERFVTHVENTTLTLDKPLELAHQGDGAYRSEVADLSRNVVIESADPDGVRGHTMYHLDSAGGISYAEFRHLGKEGVLGKYALHFHLAGASMRGSGVVGASIWDSRNRWITIHGTDGLLVRDCVGYQSVGHGFFLEDGTEQYNVFDRNLAVQAFRGKPLPKQALPFDENEGAGFWWANGRNTFIRNVSCENDAYGYRFQIERRNDFDPTLALRTIDGGSEKRDVRTLPFLRFQDNESHSEGLYSFDFGDDRNGSVHGDRQHPFIARNLKAWETHYVLRPNLQFFLMDGLNVWNAVYGVYHPDYDAHVYRNILLKHVTEEPINRGHDDDSIQYGSFTYENLAFEDCLPGRDPLIQLTCTSPHPGMSGHFRNVTYKNSISRMANIVDLGGGPRNDKLENGVAYYFHDYPAKGRTTRVVSVKFPDMMRQGAYASVAAFTGPDVRAGDASSVAFPTLLDPIDDLAPVSMITGIHSVGSVLRVRGLSEDNGVVRSITVNGLPAPVLSTGPGVVYWEITLPRPRDGRLIAKATDAAGNQEKSGHIVLLTDMPRIWKK